MRDMDEPVVEPTHQRDLRRSARRGVSRRSVLSGGLATVVLGGTASAASARSCGRCRGGGEPTGPPARIHGRSRCQRPTGWSCRPATRLGCSSPGAIRCRTARPSVPTPATPLRIRSSSGACTTTASSTSNSAGRAEGLLVQNSEYTDDAILFPTGPPTGTRRRHKSQNAHGVNIIHVSKRRGRAVAGRPAFPKRGSHHRSDAHLDRWSGRRRRPACGRRRTRPVAWCWGRSTTVRWASRLGVHTSLVKRTSTASSSRPSPTATRWRSATASRRSRRGTAGT